MRTAILAISLCACGSFSGYGDPDTPPRQMGVDENLAEADRQDQQAIAHEDSAIHAEAYARQQELSCGDVVLQEQVTSGGEQLMPQAVCFAGATRGNDDTDGHREAAAKLRADARQHRAEARALEAAERERCEGVTELNQTPFSHREEIISVTAIVEDGEVRGASIRFRTRPDRGAEALQHAIDCHRARAASLGWEPRHEGYDPTLLLGAEVEVTDEHEGGVQVDIRADDEATALAIFGRAEALLTTAK